MERHAGVMHLIETVKARSGMAFDVDVARRSDGVVTKQDLASWKRRGIKNPSPDKMAGLAKALDVPVYQVWLAWLQDMGVDVPQDVRTPEQAIRHDYALSPQTRQTLLLILQNERS